MTQPIVLSETFVQKSAEFSNLVWELLGERQGPVIRDLFWDGGDNLTGRIRTLAQEAVYEKAECLTHYAPTSGEFRDTARAMCETLLKFERFAQVWRDLYNLSGCSRDDTLHLVERIVRDRLPFDF